MKYRVTQDVEWVSGYLRDGHFERIVEVDSEEELKEKLENEDIYLELVVDDYRVEDYGDRFEYKYELIDEPPVENTPKPMAVKVFHYPYMSNRYHCPKCGKQQKSSIVRKGCYCERCGQYLEVRND